MMTGRGIISILQGIVGVMYFLEGFWAVVKKDADMLFRFVVFLMIFGLLCVFMASMHFITREQFCQTAQNEAELATCEKNVFLSAWLMFTFAFILLVPMSVATMFTYRKLKQEVKSTSTATSHK